MRNRLHRGFTLIELMVVVAIVGILSSIAIPSFARLQLRARAAERAVIMTTVKRAIDEYFAREGRFPYDSGGITWLLLTTDEPNTTPGPAKRPWRVTSASSLDHWPLLAMTVDGGVYYSYGGYAYQQGDTRTYILYAYGDLDGDNEQNRWQKQWTYVGTAMQRYVGGTLDCPECSYATVTGTGTF